MLVRRNRRRVAGRERRWEEYWYRLRYPNHEVYRSLNNGLLNAWSPDRRAALGNRRRLGDVLLANDFTGLKALIDGLFAAIPGEWFVNNPIARYEGYYAMEAPSQLVFVGCLPQPSPPRHRARAATVPHPPPASIFADSPSCYTTRNSLNRR